MKNTSGILLNNAYESWALAVKTAHEIVSGMVTLQKRKQFVSSLHNAVELFLKQIMINKGDHRVATVKANKLDPSGQPLATYYNNNDLNTYFDSLTNDDAKKFMSIEFNELIQIHKSLLDGYPFPNQSFSIELGKLKDLRNSEMHFSIKDDLFLTCTEFVELYNFMIDFYGVLQMFNLIPTFSTPLEDTSRLFFDVPKLNNNLSYEYILKTSAKANIVFNVVTKDTVFDDLPSFYDLAACYKEELLANNIFVDEGAIYVKALIDNGFIDIDVHYDMVEKSYDHFEPDFDGYVVIVKKHLI